MNTRLNSHTCFLSTVYIDITVCETWGGISLFLTVDAGIKCFCEAVTMVKGENQPHLEHASFDPS